MRCGNGAMHSGPGRARSAKLRRGRPQTGQVGHGGTHLGHYFDPHRLVNRFAAGYRYVCYYIIPTLRLMGGARLL